MITYGVICVAAGWLESKRVNNSAVTATVTIINDYKRAAPQYIQDIVTKHKRDVNLTAKLPRDIE